ncbi:MAG: hypothetical protein GIW97_05580, partial [Candidatus Eremiobacteraeota bacterium]|nr:hypothetical protein [Candidatus Eremiobacteraeota bacterium]
MPDPNKRRLAVTLIAAAALLLLAIFIGKQMGDRVITKATEEGQTGVGNTLTFSPNPGATDAVPMGPNWKRTQVLAAAPDPGFPDPRVPPAPLPTPVPTPKPTERPKDTPTPVPVRTPRSEQTPTPMPTSPYYLHGPSITPAPLHPTPEPINTNPKNMPTPETTPLLGPSN